MTYYPDPFSPDMPEQEEALVELVEEAHSIARSMYGDEGEGYDMNLMVYVLLSQGWEPPDGWNEE